MTAALPISQLPDDAADAVPPMIRFDKSQRRFFEDRSRVIVVNWHRQKGKDFTAAGKAVDSGLRNKQDWFIVSLTQRQADATFRKARNFAKAFQLILKMQGEITYSDRQFEAFDKELNQAFVFTAREIHLPNGARIVSLPGRDPDTLAGLTGNVIFTEFGLFPNGGYAHWSVIFPITTRGYQVVVISTPRGKNTKFYELWRDTETYSVHTCSIYQSVEQEGFTLTDNNGQPCTIVAFRRLYNDEGKWPREYECQFTGDLEALIKWAQLEEAAALSAGLDFRCIRFDGEAPWDHGIFSRALPAGGRIEVGWDVARTGDLSVVTGNFRIARAPAHLLFVVLMRNVTFARQRAVVTTLMDMQPSQSVGCGDATGLGMESNEVLEQKYGDRWEGVNFGGTRKKELASGLATAFSDKGQTVPALDGPYKFVATDLYAIQQDTTGGSTTLDETDNPLLPESHCDIAWSLALARRAGIKTPKREHRPSRRNKPAGW